MLYVMSTITDNPIFSFDGERLLLVREAVTALGVSERTVFRWIDAGRLPHPVRIAGNRLAWRESEIRMSAPKKKGRCTDQGSGLSIEKGISCAIIPPDSAGMTTLSGPIHLPQI